MVIVAKSTSDNNKEVVACCNKRWCENFLQQQNILLPQTNLTQLRKLLPYMHIVVTYKHFHNKSTVAIN